MTQELFAKLLDALERSLGPVIAQLVAGIIIREAKLDFNDEQESKLNQNRLRALAAYNHELRRAGILE